MEPQLNDLLEAVKESLNLFNQNVAKLINLTMQEVTEKQPITIKTHLTKKEAGRKMAELIRDIYMCNRLYEVIGLRLDGEVCYTIRGAAGGVTMAEFYDRRTRVSYPADSVRAAEDPEFWNNNFLDKVGRDLINSYKGNIHVEYGEVRSA